MTYLCITVRWLDERYHGLLGRAGPPEWPPSPFRLFQALVAGAARYGQLKTASESLEWLESLLPPVIVAPRSCAGQIVTRYVPNNDSDEVPDRQGRLTGKTSKPTIFRDPPVVHYIWAVGKHCPLAPDVIRLSRCLSCFGLGIDLAYADAHLFEVHEFAMLSGIRWYPKPGTFREDGLLRVPTRGSMQDLSMAHASALARIEHGRPLRPVDKPRIFDRVFYSSVERPIGRPYVVFALRQPNDDTYSHPHAKLMHIAGMARNRAIRAMKEVPPPGVDDPGVWVRTFVAGHREPQEDEHRQLSYIPLPSIGHQHADAMIRRVMVVAPFDEDGALFHLADHLDGVQLQPENRGDGPILERIRPDGVVRQYLGHSKVWASVTPVILPGHDDHRPAKTANLIKKALLQSGIDQMCRFSWGALPNFNNCLTARKGDGKQGAYFRPDHLNTLTATHIRVEFEYPVAGPLSIGAGRHCGFGVMAAVREP